MSITLKDDRLNVTEQDHQDLYEVYCEQGEPVGAFTCVTVQFEDEWRHGVENLLVVKVEGHEGLWGTKVRDQTGDEYLSWLDPQRLRQGAALWPVDAVPSVTYQIRK